MKLLFLPLWLLWELLEALLGHRHHRRRRRTQAEADAQLRGCLLTMLVLVALGAIGWVVAMVVNAVRHPTTGTIFLAAAAITAPATLIWGWVALMRRGTVQPAPAKAQGDICHAERLDPLRYVVCTAASRPT